jgi:hypothetical protein
VLGAQQSEPRFIVPVIAAMPDQVDLMERFFQVCGCVTHLSKEARFVGTAGFVVRQQSSRLCFTRE